MGVCVCLGVCVCVFVWMGVCVERGGGGDGKAMSGFHEDDTLMTDGVGGIRWVFRCVCVRWQFFNLSFLTPPPPPLFIQFFFVLFESILISFSCLFFLLFSSVFLISVFSFFLLCPCYLSFFSLIYFLFLGNNYQ